MTRALGATYLGDRRTEFLVWAPRAEIAEIRLLEPGECVVALRGEEHGYHHAVVDGVEPGRRYFFRSLSSPFMQQGSPLQVDVAGLVRRARTAAQQPQDGDSTASLNPAREGSCAGLNTIRLKVPYTPLPNPAKTYSCTSAIDPRHKT